MSIASKMDLATTRARARAEHVDVNRNGHRALPRPMGLRGEVRGKAAGKERGAVGPVFCAAAGACAGTCADLPQCNLCSSLWNTAAAEGRALGAITSPSLFKGSPSP